MRSVELHVTVVHPRTSDRGLEAFTALGGTRIDGTVRLREMLYTETSTEGMTILDRFPLTDLQPPVRVAAGVLRRGDQVLLCHRHAGRANFPDVWDLPGGHAEAGESISETLVRELAEELDVEVEPPTTPPWKTVAADGLELSVFLIDRWTGEPHNASSGEHDDIRWVSADDLADLNLAHHSYVEMLREALQ